VDQIAVPTIVIHAADDPFIRIQPESRAKLLANSNIRYIETAHGGHCAFLAAPNGYDGYWAERQIVDFLRQAGEGGSLGKPQAAARAPSIASTRSS
jgi:predicted alpha/beta-fold hydrolase